MNLTHRWVYLILAIGLVLRTFLLWGSWEHGTEIKGDERAFQALAEGVLDGRGFVLPTETGFTPTAQRGPVYPIFLATVYRLTGRVLVAPLITQVTLSLVLIWGVFAVGQRLGKPNVGLVAALFLAVDPTMIAGCLYHLSEVLFSVLFFIALVLLLWARSNRYLRVYVLAGVAMGVATLCRPNTLYMWLWLMPWVVGWPVKSARVLNWAGYAMGFWLIAGLWYVRNYFVFGCLFFTAISSFNLYMYRAAWVEAQATGKSWAEVRQEFKSRIVEETREAANPVAAKGELYTKYSFEVFRRYPLQTAVMVVDGVLRTLVGPSRPLVADLLGLPQGGSGFFSVDGSPLSRLLHGIRHSTIIDWFLLMPDMFCFGLLYGGITLLLWLRGARRDRCLPQGLFLWVVLYLLLSSAGPEAYARFRIPLVPVLVLLSGEGWVVTWDVLRERWQARS